MCLLHLWVLVKLSSATTQIIRLQHNTCCTPWLGGGCRFVNTVVFSLIIGRLKWLVALSDCPMPQWIYYSNQHLNVGKTQISPEGVIGENKSCTSWIMWGAYQWSWSNFWTFSTAVLAGHSLPHMFYKWQVTYHTNVLLLQFLQYKAYNVHRIRFIQNIGLQFILRSLIKCNYTWGKMPPLRRCGFTFKYV